VEAAVWSESGFDRDSQGVVQTGARSGSGHVGSGSGSGCAGSGCVMKYTAAAAAAAAEGQGRDHHLLQGCR
jgi:hypothetical protein